MTKPAVRPVGRDTPTRCRILCLEAYYGGSHRAFLDTWIAHSRHDWTLRTLPARHWKWRMRGSAMWFAQLRARDPAGRFDAIVTSDMTAVAELRAMADPAPHRPPVICYFHENQLTYPLSPHDVRDYQYGFTNITSVLASTQAWFNSYHHRDSFLRAAAALLAKMPDHRPRIADRLLHNSAVWYPAVEQPEPASDKPRRGDQPLRILWNHRWEYDKNPRPFLTSLVKLRDAGCNYEVVFLGERFRAAPPALGSLVDQIADRVVVDGFAQTRAAYWRELSRCDVVVSTAIQENFGLAVLEAILAGCHPLLPDRLSYPEILPSWAHSGCLYPNYRALTARLRQLADDRIDPNLVARLADDVARRYAAHNQCWRLDDALESACRSTEAM